MKDLKRALFEIGMKQCDLADSVGLSKAYINDIVLGRRAPSVFVAEKSFARGS